MRNICLAVIFFLSCSTVGHAFSSGAPVYDKDGLFAGEFASIINVANRLYGLKIERKAMEDYEVYLSRMQDRDEKIAQLEAKKLKIIINPDSLEYDWANNIFNISVNFPVPAKRINDFSEHNAITYKVQADKATAREYLKFKNDLRLNIIFKIRKGFILVENTDIYYRESRIASH